MKISVIIPVFNAETYLQRCLHSFVEQTNGNFEVIIIDDGSTDRSAAICHEYASKYSNFVLVRKKNGGVCSARNLGIEKARGEYITFVDADDTVVPNMIELILSHIKNKPDLLVFGFTIIDEATDLPRGKTIISMEGKVVAADFPALYNDGLLTTVTSKVYRRMCIIENNIRFDERIDIGEDTFFNLVYLKFTDTIEVVKEWVYNWYKRAAGSLSSKLTTTGVNSRIIMMHEFQDLLDKKRVNRQKHSLAIMRFIFTEYMFAIMSLFHKDANTTVLYKIREIRRLNHHDHFQTVFSIPNGRSVRCKDILVRIVRLKSPICMCIYVYLSKLIRAVRPSRKVHWSGV